MRICRRVRLSQTLCLHWLIAVLDGLKPRQQLNAPLIYSLLKSASIRREFAKSILLPKISFPIPMAPERHTTVAIIRARSNNCLRFRTTRNYETNKSNDEQAMIEFNLASALRSMSRSPQCRVDQNLASLKYLLMTMVRLRPKSLLAPLHTVKVTAPRGRCW